MIRKIAWDAFKNTGDINAFLELKQIENIQEQINNNKLEENGSINWNTETKINEQKVD